jgi:uroporphyrinogen-III synthase
MPGTVVITASAGAFPGLADGLRALPVAVEECPLMAFAPPLDWAPVDAALTRLPGYGAVAFTSPRSALALMERVRGLAAPPPDPPASVWAAGAGTAQALGSALGPVREADERTVGTHGAARALAEAMVADGVHGPVLFPCGDLRRDELPARLRDDGLEVVEITVYRSVLAGETDARRAAERARVLVVASPSVADLLARVCPPGVRPPLVAVGPTTAAAARASGWPPAGVAARPSADALVAAVRAVLAQR